VLDLCGQIFGRLTVVKHLGGDRWHCRCVCGNAKEAIASNLKTGNTSSCGCIRRADLSGQVFGLLTAVSRAETGKWRCRCACGGSKEATTGNLRAGHVKSCGCTSSRGHLPRKRLPQSQATDLSGLCIGKLTVIERDESKTGLVWWLCRCDCGQVVSIRANCLTRKDPPPQQSCGCARGEPVQNLVGHRFGRLEVLERVGRGVGGALWRCICDCGKETQATTGRLQGKDRPKRSCGCGMDRTENLVGQRFGRLVVVRRAGSRRGAQWECRCDCGNFTLACAGDLKKGRPRSCGCLRGNPSSPPQTWTHLAGTVCSPEYVTWQAMRTRCATTNNPRYGGRGIKIHPAWIDDFEAFFEHVGPRPSPDHSLDRIDNDGNYEPGNVRWATRKEQAANRSTTKVDEWGRKFIRLWFERGYKAKEIATVFDISPVYAYRVNRHAKQAEAT